MAIPQHHARFARALNTVTALAMIPLIYGLVFYELFATLLGLCLVITGKLWFLDRMVWLYQDMKDSDPLYASWLY